MSVYVSLGLKLELLLKTTKENYKYIVFIIKKFSLPTKQIAIKLLLTVANMYTSSSQVREQRGVNVPEDTW